MRQLRRATTARIVLTTLGVALLASACGPEPADDATERPTCLPATPSSSEQGGAVPSEPETSPNPDVIVITGCEVAYSDDADYYEPLSTDDSPNSEMDLED
jgi:hypothetical protein